MQNVLRPTIIVSTSGMVYRLHPRGDLRHIPEHGGQAGYPVSIQRGHIHAIIRACGFSCKDSQHLRPVRGLPLNVDAVIVSGLQLLQLGVVGDIHLRHGLSYRHSIRCVTLCRKIQPKGGACHSRDDDNDYQRHQNHRAANETGQCGDQGSGGTAEHPSCPLEQLYRCLGGLFCLCRSLVDLLLRSGLLCC